MLPHVYSPLRQTVRQLILRTTKELRFFAANRRAHTVGAADSNLMAFLATRTISEETLRRNSLVNGEAG
jgi:hypothetical protein